MENNYSFFSNQTCKHFPCHNEVEKEDFNCLFCYCPLYAFKEKCGGNLIYSKKIKDCSKCCFPHIPENYEIIVSKLKEMYKRG